MRGVLFFLAVLVTIGLLAPLWNQPERTEAGTVVTETYFGLFRYLTLRTELNEPHYSMTTRFDAGRIALTILAVAGLWGVVGWVLVRTRSSAVSSGSADPT